MKQKFFLLLSMTFSLCAMEYESEPSTSALATQSKSKYAIQSKKQSISLKELRDAFVHFAVTAEFIDPLMPNHYNSKIPMYGQERRALLTMQLRLVGKVPDPK